MYLVYVNGDLSIYLTIARLQDCFNTGLDLVLAGRSSTSWSISIVGPMGWAGLLGVRGFGVMGFTEL